MTLSVRLQHRQGDFTLDARFEAPTGITVLFGRSGSGKTTLVNALAGLIRPDAGRIAVDDRVLFDSDRGLCLPPHRRRLGYVFQEGRLFPHLSVRQNLLYGRWFAARVGPRADLAQVVEMLGIGALLDRRPAALSGGEKQRVAICRALINDPAIIFADEPTGNLDSKNGDAILDLLLDLHRERHTTLVMVTHSQEIADMAARVITLHDGHLLSDTRRIPLAAG